MWNGYTLGWSNFKEKKYTLTMDNGYTSVLQFLFVVCTYIVETKLRGLMQ
jgi:hypothetical protein